MPAEHDPEQGGRPVQRPKDGAEHRAEPGDIQKLDEKNLVAGQFNVVHAVALAFDRRGRPKSAPNTFSTNAPYTKYPPSSNARLPQKYHKPDMISSHIC